MLTQPPVGNVTASVGDRVAFRLRLFKKKDHVSDYLMQAQRSLRAPTVVEVTDPVSPHLFECWCDGCYFMSPWKNDVFCVCSNPKKGGP